MLVNQPIFGASAVRWETLSPDLALGLARFDSGDIKPILGDLFERSFRDPPPDFPVHYVCYGQNASGLHVLGYGHCTIGPRYYLGGGMCTDFRALRKLQSEQRQLIAARGGVAQFLIENIFMMSGDKEAVFSYVGHRVALEIDLRSGFMATAHPHLIVHWTGDCPIDAGAVVDEVQRLGPF